MNNKTIRQLAKDKGVLLWEIAEQLGITDGNFSRRLRRELPDEEQQRIATIIEEIAAERGA